MANPDAFHNHLLSSGFFCSSILFFGKKKKIKIKLKVIQNASKCLFYSLCPRDVIVYTCPFLQKKKFQLENPKKKKPFLRQAFSCFPSY